MSSTDWTDTTINSTDWTKGSKNSTDWTETTINSTSWESEDPGGSAGNILLEGSGAILTENGNNLVLE